jgi:Putative polyhydroxyalkanoic acid system protein (PHA_gran_rgn)
MMTAADPLVVTISHRLGRDEAKRRIESGLDAIRGELARHVKEMNYTWDGYRLDFRVSAMMQTITGRLEVFDDSVKVELGLPRLLHLLAKRIAGRIERRGTALLEGPKEKAPKGKE